MQTRPIPTSWIARNMPGLTILGMLLLLYIPLLLRWVDGWLNKNISTEHEYFSHGLIGLPFAVYLVWNRGDRWQNLPDQTHFSGVIVLLIGVLCYLSNLVDLVNLSLPIALTGICLCLKGIPGLRLQSFPLLLTLLATPNEIPYLIAPFTLPLQKLIAGTAGFILLQAGLEVRVEDIYLFVNNQIVEVAPYCAGLKMMFTSLYVGLMLLEWTSAWGSRRRTSLFFGGIILLSVIANIIRNTLLTFFHGTGQSAAFVWLHDSWGGDLYSAGMLLLLIPLLRFLESSIPDSEEEDDEDPPELELEETS
jgi:cyanoexosortase B